MCVCVCMCMCVCVCVCVCVCMKKRGCGWGEGCQVDLARVYVGGLNYKNKNSMKYSKLDVGCFCSGY